MLRRMEGQRLYNRARSRRRILARPELLLHRRNLQIEDRSTLNCIPSTFSSDRQQVRCRFFELVRQFPRLLEPLTYDGIQIGCGSFQKECRWVVPT